MSNNRLRLKKRTLNSNKQLNKAEALIKIKIKIFWIRFSAMIRISIHFTLKSKKLHNKESRIWRNTINNVRSKAKRQERQRTNWKIKRLKDTKFNVIKRPLRKHWLNWMKRIWMNKVWIIDSIIDSSSSNGDLRNKKKES